MKKLALLLLTSCATTDPTTYECGLPNLPLYIDVDHSASDLTAQIDEAANFWNEGAGFLLLLPIYGQHPTAFVGAVRVEGTIGDRGETRRELADCELKKITISLPFDSQPRRIRHELGHALGLQHDSSRFSIMNPDPNAGSEIAENDKEALRLAYIGKN